MSDMKADVLRTLALLAPTGTIELRALGRSMWVERFDEDEREKAAGWACRADVQPGNRAVYVVMNPFNESGIVATGVDDAAVTARRWLLIDVDPIRPKDTNATRAELEIAVATAKVVEDWLSKDQRWPAPVRALSGNGAHLLYQINIPNDPAAKALVEGVLKYLSAEFSNAKAHVDTTVGNSARITKLYSTTSRKGPHSDERPHRESKITRVPAPLLVVAREQLDAVAARVAVQAPAERPVTNHVPGESAYDLGDVLARVVVLGTKLREGATWHLIKCPWAFEHSTSDGPMDSGIVVQPDGALGFKCFHSHCQGRKWEDLRNHLAIDTKAWKERERQKAQRPAIVAPAAAQDAEPGSDEPEALRSTRITICDRAKRMGVLYRMDQYAKTGAMPGAIASRMKRLDGMLLGGFRPGKFYLLGGETGRGKTTLLLQWAIAAARQVGTVGVITPEMDEDSVSERVLAAQTGHGVTDYRASPGTVRDKWGVCDVPQNIRATFDPLDMVPFVAEEKPDLLIVDYAQQAVSYESERRHTALAQLGADCLRIAKERGIPVIMGTQVNATAEREFTVRETRILEHQADAVIYLDIVYDKQTDGEGKRLMKSQHLVVAKNRHGSAGRIEIDWQQSLFRFEERR